MIGSAALTIPAAVWLLGQGPQKGVHHPEKAHEEREEGEKDKEEPAEEAYEAKPGETPPSKGSALDPEHEKESTKKRLSEQQSDESGDSDESKEGSSDEGSDDSSAEGEEGGEDKSSKGDDDKASPKMSDDGYELPGPNAPGQINYKPGTGKGPGEQQKGPRRPPELKGEKDVSQRDMNAEKSY